MRWSINRPTSKEELNYVFLLWIVHCFVHSFTWELPLRLSTLSKFGGPLKLAALCGRTASTCLRPPLIKKYNSTHRLYLTGSLNFTPSLAKAERCGVVCNTLAFRSYMSWVRIRTCSAYFQIIVRQPSASSAYFQIIVRQPSASWDHCRSGHRTIQFVACCSSLRGGRI